MRKNNNCTPPKFLISGYTGLGHFVLRTVLVQKLEELFPDSEIVIIAGNNYGTEFVVPEYETYVLKETANFIYKFIFFIKLRKENIDVALLTFDASPGFLIRGCIIAGIPIRVGHVLEGAVVPDYYYSQSVTVKKKKVRNEIDMNLDLIEPIYNKGFKREYLPCVSINNVSASLTNFDLENNNYICVQISAANGQVTNKLWLPGNFSTLIQKLLLSYPDLKIVALGDKGDSLRVNKVCDNIKSNRLLNLSGKTNIEEAKSLIYHCRFLIAHDSGLLHLGNALKTNVIAIYGFSSPDYYIENLPSCHVIKEKCDCDESDKPTIFPGVFGEMTEEAFALSCPEPECMKRISVGKVYDKCVEIYNE
jgi:ADP-heptose:LPS heptosyltransferase